MRIVQLTPGTGGFYCGSCLRDNALAAALGALGHEVLAVPLYLPHLTDEANQSAGNPVLFGGVNAYLQHASALFRATPAWLDRLFDAGPLLRWAARRAGATDPRALGALTVSTLRGAAGRQAKEVARVVRWLAAGPRPDVLLLSNALLLGLARPLREGLGGTPVACTLQGESAFLDALPEPERSEAWKLAAAAAAAGDVARFLPVSRWYGREMFWRLGLAPER
ncbi:MAG: glycosyltransferase family 1 protein, partial [Planctomycetes bacterium]|nr:glycosyltransferase family 1 protein [Planctomycetota bacterium]